VTKKLRSFANVLEGGGANLNADKRKVLDQLIAKGLSWLLAKSRLSNTNLPEKLNNFSPSAALHQAAANNIGRRSE
jgi:hypothetical protein